MTSIEKLLKIWQNFDVFYSAKSIFKQFICHVINSGSCINEFIKLVAKKVIKSKASLTFYRFSSTGLINSIKDEKSCKILYIQQFKHALGALKNRLIGMGLWNIGFG